jgi:hypothetical protein
MAGAKVSPSLLLNVSGYRSFMGVFLLGQEEIQDLFRVFTSSNVC